jgi:hypothetical protein
MGGVLDGCMMDPDKDRKIYVDCFSFYTAYLLVTTSYTYFFLVRVIKSQSMITFGLFRLPA